MTAHKIPLVDCQYSSSPPSPTHRPLEPVFQVLQPVPTPSSKFGSTPPIDTAVYGRETPLIVDIFPYIPLKDAKCRDRLTRRRSSSFPVITSLSATSSAGNYLTNKASLLEPHCTQDNATHRNHRKMPKKRRSLQSFFIPSFFRFSHPASESSNSPPPISSVRRTASALASLSPPPQPLLSRTPQVQPVPIPSTSSQTISPPAETSSSPAQRNSVPAQTSSVPVKRSSITAKRSSVPTKRSSVSTQRSSPPPDYLLDEDPFANLSHGGRSRHTSATFSPPGLSQSLHSRPPRSLLSSSRPESSISSISSAASPSTPDLSIPRESVHPPHTSRTLSPVHPRPAHLKPAFSARPSLPSLHSLAQMSVMIPKVRKGKVGARLPSEPWDIDINNSSIIMEDPTTANLHDFLGPAPYHPSSDDPPDFTHNLDFDISLDSYVDPDIEPDSPMQPHVYGTQHPSAASRFSLGKVDEHDSEGSPSDLACSPVSLFSLPPLSRSTSLSSTSNSSSGSRMTSLIGQGQLHQSQGSISNLQTSWEERISDPSTCLSDFDDSAYPMSHGTCKSLPDPTPDRPSFSPESWNSANASHTDVSLLDEPHVAWEPGTSAGTIRSPLREWASENKRFALVQRSGADYDSKTEMIDGGGWENQGRSTGQGHNAWDQSAGSGGGSSSGGHEKGNGSGGNQSGSSGSGNGGRGDDDKDDNGRSTHGRSAFSSPSDTEDSTSDEDSSTDDYGEDPSSHRAYIRSLVRARVAEIQPEDLVGADDDIPLAQRIPTALKAQRTIQKQVRDERDQRRKERALRRQQQQEQNSEPSSRSRQMTLRPAAAPDSASISSSREAALHASISSQRPHTKTLTGNSVAPLDLTQKLLKVQHSSSQHPHHLESLTSHSLMQRGFYAQPKGFDRAGVKEPSSPHIPAQDRQQDQGLRRARSFHKPAPLDMDHHFVPTRSVPNSNSRNRDPNGLSSGYAQSFPGDELIGIEKLLKLQKSNQDGVSVRSLSRRPSTGAGKPSISGGGPTTVGRRPSTGGRSSASGGRPSTGGARSNGSGGRPSIGDEQTPRTSAELTVGRSSQRPRVPPLRLAEEALANLAQSTTKVQMAQQRVFIGDMQRFNMVELWPSTSAKDVLRTIESQGALSQPTGSGGWMLWEMAQDFGMERPIRNFELLSDVSANWNKDKTVNTYMLRITPLAPLLSRSAIPSSSPKHSGYVEWESKRGKWSKRWMELREHSLWLSKSDKGKDEVFLCSLSTFDAYFVTRPYKSPKPFVFSVKSTDNITLFENTADYLHVFSCGQKDGDKWMEKILLARSYVLQQERTVLFTRSGSPGAAIPNVGARKPSTGQRPTQPLVQVATPFAVVPTAPVFEPGSLLAQS